eukprot:TRINITY_DN507_c0_g5_i1.p1 TRINITY_DN507_c0_g5~~TRINITY_DN507_c0_g5_i1.p1  ORF type:complete len:407 (+),score=142.25 TRINITY_DN507_c0_g5_i1:64-1221(+)
MQMTRRALCRSALKSQNRNIAQQKGELAEYSVVYSDRALNHMSPTFVDTMQGISKGMKEVYNATSVAVVPGSGSFGMEAAARQFATGKKAMVFRNGFFSFRWSQILDDCAIPSSTTLMKAQPVDGSAEPAFVPYPIEQAVEKIRQERPEIIFAPHVETSAGMILPDSYIKTLSEAAREVGALFLLDCIASGAVWVDMKALGVDILLSAPQKGWTGPACAGLVMLGERAREQLDSTQSTSFVMNLKTWVTLMEKYEAGEHMYHCTMPTDALRTFNDVIDETRAFGFEKAKAGQIELGEKMRDMIASFGYKSIAADGFGAPGVLVSYGGPELVGKFKAQGVQIAGGVPLKIDEPQPFNTFRFGFFGLDKIAEPDQYVAHLKNAISKF